MAFGQPSGPPATFRQIEELTSLLHDAGHSDFRDARGPMGFTQRQSGGRFTRDEAAAYIERLQVEASGPSAPPAEPGAGAAASRPARSGGRLRGMPSSALAAELERRGWTVRGPDSP